MATYVFEPCNTNKIRKRKQNLFGFRTFASHKSSTVRLSSSPFRDNVRLFLQEFAEVSDHSVSGLPTWSTFLVNEQNGAVFPLYTIEETLQFSLTPFCQHCKCVGWGDHFASKRRYHVIIPAEDEWDDALKGNCVENRTTHLLYGLIHCNGFGHLLCISGSEEDSNSNCVPKVQIMDLWDRICTILRTRKISTNDALKRSSMELRLLYGVAYGQSWFGKWGYKFGRGSYGVTEDQYNSAINTLSTLDLNKIMAHFKNNKQGRVIHQIIYRYRGFSETELATISDLLQFMLDFKSRANTCSKQMHSSSKTHQCESQTDLSTESESATFLSSVAKCDSRWPRQRLEHVAEVVWNILREVKGIKNGKTGLPRQELRDFARQFVGDTGLIDYVLKSIDGSIVGNQIVRRWRNPSTKMVEFSIQGIVDRSEVEHLVGLSGLKTLTAPESRLDVDEDVLFLYRNVLLGYPESNSVSSATRMVLDSKHFVKEWEFMGENNDHLMTITCRVLPSFDELETELTRPLPPGELVVVPPWITIGELKVAAQCALRDTYCIMDRFVVKQIGGLRGLEDERVLSCAVEPGAHVWVRGCGLDLGTKLRYEGGPRNRTVDCTCGVRDDDGERMVTCDGCHVWQHTRCNGIEDDAVFLCVKCRC